MCGICGYVNPSGLELADVVRMNRLAAHRGPDGEAYWVWDDRSPVGDFIRREVVDAHQRRGSVALGHRRLAILDLSDRGLQPMSTQDGQVWIVFNGEIYNYLELRAELVPSGYVFHTGTDTEMILAAYDHWGTGCFARFNGMWGLAIVDLRERHLVLSRDRLGVKPLYVWCQDRVIAFASEIKQFFALPGAKAIANMDAVVEYIDTGYEAPPATFFKGIQAFPPGNWARIPLDQPESPVPQPFWFPEDVRASGIHRTDAIEQVRRVFVDSVKLRLRSDVPVGVCLSGGLDSSSIFSHVRRLQSEAGGSTYAFSVAFEDRRFDEREYIEAVVDAIGGRSYYSFPTADDALDDLDRFIFHHDEPPGSLSPYAAWSVMRLARQNRVPVLLNGQGGDELFSGYWHAYYLFLRQKLTHAPWVVAQHLLGALAPGGNPMLVTQLLPHLQKYRDRKKRRNRTLVLPSWQTKGHTVAANWATEALKLAPNDFRLYEVRQIHLPRLLKWEDRNSMAFGVEGRYPFLDYRLVELAMSLPPEMNFGRGWNKLLVREALADGLPASVRWRRSKMGFETPQSDWIRTTLRSALLNWLTCLSDQFRSIVDLPRLHKMADGLLNAENIHKMDERHVLLIRLFFLDRWLKTFGVAL